MFSIKKIIKNNKKRNNNSINTFHSFPFGKKPWADSQTYLSIWKEEKKNNYPIINDVESKLGLSISKDWFHDLALHTQVVIKKSKICYQHGRLLYVKLSDYCMKKKYDTINILETGTARGFSALCMAYALSERKVSGKIISIDPLPHNVPMYWNCIDDLQGVKTRKQLLENYSDLIEKYILFFEGKSKHILRTIESTRINFAFLDGAHEYEDVKYEINYVSKRQKSGDIIFFDDYQKKYFPGIVKAVQELQTDGHYTVETIIANDQRGYAIAEKK